MVDVTGPHPILKGPQKLGAYTLLRRIGRGGMAEVYLATKDGDLVDRHLVVKRMLPHLADDERFIQMFLREARVAMKLSHPNVVQMLEVGVEGEEYFIAMEHLEGLSAYHLAKRVWAAGQSLPLELIAHTLSDAALGLHHAHTLRDLGGANIGLVHRDISPDNIFVTKNGTSKILDFGIALGAFAGSLTRTGEIKGKVRYMSPEQMTKAQGVDARADVFSLGATFYWLLTGRHAFDGDNDVVAMRSVLESEPTPPSVVNSALPKAIDDVIAAMMVKDRDKRTPSAEAAYEALLPFAGGAAGRKKVVEFLNDALLLPPVKRRVEGESDAPLAIPAAVPSSQSSSSPSMRPSAPAAPLAPMAAAWLGQAKGPAEVTTPERPAPTLGSDFPASSLPSAPMLSASIPDAPPEHGTLASGEPTSSTPFTTIDGETLENALRPRRPKPRRRGLVLAASVGTLAAVALAVTFVVVNPTAPPLGDPPVAVEPVEPVAPIAPVVAPIAPALTPAPALAPLAPAVAPAVAAPVVPVPDVPVVPVVPPPAADVVAPAAAVAAPVVPVVAAVPAGVVPPSGDVVEEPEPEPEPVVAGGGRRTAKAPGKTVKAKAPGYVEWRTIAGALVGRGSGTLSLQRDTKQIVAVDTKRKGRTRVDVRDDGVDYGALPKGELSFVVLPFADVFIGRDSLGRTPIDVVTLVAGSYDVRLVWNDKTKVVHVEVEPGKRASVRANMAQ